MRYDLEFPLVGLSFYLLIATNNYTPAVAACINKPLTTVATFGVNEKCEILRG